MSKKKQNIHYVNNKQFSLAVVEYVQSVNDAKEKGEPLPVVTDYIAECFLKIAEGLSHKANFIRYTYREEMVMDAVENCLKAIENYNIEAATRTGTPNAFAYFTQISWYAFLRRIAKEKKQQDVKSRYMLQSGIEQYMMSDEVDAATLTVMQSFFEQLKGKIDAVKEKDDAFAQFLKQEKERKKHTSKVDSDLDQFLE